MADAKEAKVTKVDNRPANAGDHLARRKMQEDIAGDYVSCGKNLHLAGIALNSLRESLNVSFATQCAKLIASAQSDLKAIVAATQPEDEPAAAKKE